MFLLVHRPHVGFPPGRMGRCDIPVELSYAGVEHEDGGSVTLGYTVEWGLVGRLMDRTSARQEACASRRTYSISRQAMNYHDRTFHCDRSRNLTLMFVQI